MPGLTREKIPLFLRLNNSWPPSDITLAERKIPKKQQSLDQPRNEKYQGENQPAKRHYSQGKPQGYGFDNVHDHLLGIWKRLFTKYNLFNFHGGKMLSVPPLASIPDF